MNQHKTRTKTSSKETSQRHSARGQPESGDIAAKLLALRFVGFTMLLLVSSGIAAFFLVPERSGAFWNIINPLLSIAIGGIVAVWAGHRR
jgi:hypothetical protein